MRHSRSRWAKHFVSLAIMVIGVLSSSRAGADIRDAVVKIFVTANQMDFYRPWQSKGSFPKGGSGCIISGNRILTNAHVVSDHTFIQVRKEANPKKYTARLLAIGHDCDLAILTVDDEEFFVDTPSLEFGNLPELQDTVTVLGFPTGGDKLSITEGVVSRIEIIPYTQSSRKLLAVQIDAAINPGNSGGPVFQDGKIAGIAMQAMLSSQNIGYMIPVPIINHFLEDLKQEDVYDGFPSFGIEYLNTENQALRQSYRLMEEEGGVLLSRVVPFSAADGNLKEDDILLEIDGVPIASDGTVSFRNNERVGFSYLLQKRQIGETLRCRIHRDAKPQTLQVKLTPFSSLVPRPHAFAKPPYYVYGGLVFSVLSTDLLRSWGKKWWEKAPEAFMHYLLGSGRLNLSRRRQVVVLLDVLPDDLNVGYHGYKNHVITKVNDKEFDSFREFVDLLEQAQGPFVTFETSQMQKIILSTDKIDNITADILQRNHIKARYSEDVAAWIAAEE